MLAVTRDLLQLFIELDKMDGSLLKNAISVIRNQLGTAEREQAVEVIDVDAATTNNFDAVTTTPKVPSLWSAMNEAVAAPVARFTLASESPTST